MAQDRTRRMGGLVLLISVVLLAGAVTLAEGAPDTLAQYGVAGGAWVSSAWLYVLAGLLWITGATILARQFRGTGSEGWATLGQVAALMSGIAAFAIGAIGSFGFRGLATGTLFDHTEEAFTALIYTIFALGMMGTAAACAAIACFGLAMVRGAWPDWLGWTGLAIGGLAVALKVVQTTTIAISPMAYSVLYILGAVWVGAAGWTLNGRARAVAQQPAATGAP